MSTLRVVLPPTDEMNVTRDTRVVLADANYTTVYRVMESPSGPMFVVEKRERVQE
jgi:hypothetical protein